MSAELALPDRQLNFGDPEFSQDIYSECASKARLREVRLAHSEFVTKLAVYLAAERQDREALNQSFAGEPGGQTFVAERGMVAGSYLWNAEIKHRRSKVLKVKAEYWVLYSGFKDAPETYVELYFRKIARFTTYPYFRSHFAMLSASAGLTLAPLPSLTERVD